MSTTPRRHAFARLVGPLLLGAVLAAALVLGRMPEFAWLGFLVAGLYADSPGRTRCHRRSAG
jgi:hypothetical protein